MIAVLCCRWGTYDGATAQPTTADQSTATARPHLTLGPHRHDSAAHVPRADHPGRALAPQDGHGAQSGDL